MKKSIRISVAIVITILVCIVGYYGYNWWSDTRPSEENFDKVLRENWDKQQEANSNLYLSRDSGALCIRIPLLAIGDAHSKSEKPMAWSIDFYTDSAKDAYRSQQLRQLEALTKVGLLEKKSVEVNTGSETKSAVRYRMSEKGWLAAGYFDQACLKYGKMAYLGIDKYKPWVVNKRAGVTAYEVHARKGIDPNATLPEWANDPDILKEFPEIKQRLYGEDMTIMLVRGSGEWVPFGDISRPDKNKEGFEYTSKMKTRIADTKKILPTTKDEIEKIILDGSASDSALGDQYVCMSLPGSKSLPVDKTFFKENVSDKPLKYSVAIFPNKNRRDYDPVPKKTIPYLDTLETVGILKKSYASNVSGNGKDSEMLFDAWIYELASGYENSITLQYPPCFLLGKPTIEITDIQISEAEDEEEPHSNIGFKLKISYLEPPEWMKDEVLAYKWPELHGVLENGAVCSATYSFDKITRTLRNGSRKCWWAFDSHENY